MKMKDTYLICLEGQTNPSLYYKAYPGHNQITYVWTNNPEYATKFVSINGAQKEIHSKKLEKIAIKKYGVKIEIEDV